jgi:hypothetical protein
MSDFHEPLPLIPKDTFRDPELRRQTWRERRIKGIQAAPRALSADSTESQSKKEREERKKMNQKLDEIQQKLDKNADDIKVQS